MNKILIAIAFTLFSTLVFAGSVIGNSVPNPDYVYQDKDGGMIVITKDQCVLYDKTLPAARKIVVVLPDGTQQVGCAGAIDGQFVAVFETGNSQVRVVPIGMIPFKKLEGV